MNKHQQGEAFKLAATCFKAMAAEYKPPICKAYAGMVCIHPRYLPTCKGCVIAKKKEEEGNGN